MVKIRRKKLYPAFLFPFSIIRMLGKLFSRQHIKMFYFSQKTGFDISCKLSPVFWGKFCHLLRERVVKGKRKTSFPGVLKFLLSPFKKKAAKCSGLSFLLKSGIRRKTSYNKCNWQRPGSGLIFTLTWSWPLLLQYATLLQQSIYVVMKIYFCK